MKKTLIASGCSFTFEPWNWPKWVSKEMDWNLINVGMGSTGNGLISKKIIYQVEKQLKVLKPEDIVVGVMWSGVDRKEFYIDNARMRNNNDGWSQNPTNVIDRRNNWLITNIHWKLEESEMWYKNFHTIVGSFIETIEDILRIQWYLEKKNIKYFMTTYMDIFDATYKDKHKMSLLGSVGVDVKITEHPEIKYLYELIDKTKFIDIKGCYEWVIENHPLKGMPNGTIVWGTHPNEDGHRLFSKEVIIPHLKKYLNE